LNPAASDEAPAAPVEEGLHSQFCRGAGPRVEAETVAPLAPPAQVAGIDASLSALGKSTSGARVSKNRAGRTDLQGPHTINQEER
jgi:hypothetical protein